MDMRALSNLLSPRKTPWPTPCDVPHCGVADAFYDPTLYEALHQGNPGDLAFYLSRCPAPASVLELGCGSGRLAQALLEQGNPVTGVDRHRGLLGLAEARGVEVIEADITELDVGRTYDRVLLPYNGLYCLLTDAEVLRCLEGARRHLGPEGLLLLDVWYADAFHHDSPREDAEFEITESVGTCASGDAEYEVLEQSRWDPERQRLDVAYLYFAGETLAHTGQIQQRYLLVEQLESLLRRAGFAQVEISGGFSGGPVGAEGEQLVVVASV